MKKIIVTVLMTVLLIVVPASAGHAKRVDSFKEAAHIIKCDMYQGKFKTEHGTYAYCKFHGTEVFIWRRHKGLVANETLGYYVPKGKFIYSVVNKHQKAKAIRIAHLVHSKVKTDW